MNWYAFYAREVIQQVMVHLISTHISIVFIWPCHHIELSMHIHCVHDLHLHQCSTMQDFIVHGAELFQESLRIHPWT